MDNITTEVKKPTPKRRNNEKRKEKSRDAARCRRSRETEIFTDLSTALPLCADSISQLDKASIMRLAIAYLKVRDMIKLVPDTSVETKNLLLQNSSTNATDSVFLKSIDGFVLVLSTEGDFVYLSENISDYLGISQIELMGQNIYDYSHPCDHDEIKEMLSIRDKERYDSEDSKSHFLRLKCTLTAKGRSVNLKSAAYKVLHCTGHMLHATDDTLPLESNSDLRHCLVAVAQPIPHPSNIEAPLPHQTFFTKHALDMKFTYADEKMAEFLGYDGEDLLGQSLYEYHHANDANVISTAYKALFAKGQCETHRYRFLAKTGGYAWVLTQATLIYDKAQKPESVVCVNFMISGVECKEEIYAAFQLESKKSTAAYSAIELTPPPSLSPIANNATSPGEEQPQKEEVLVEDEEEEEEEKEEIEEEEITKPLIVTARIFADTGRSADDGASNRPQTATSKIFAPRTEEMSKGFLTFSDEEPGLTLMKDEPDDLTHLAPVAGDVVSLETHPFLTDILLDDFLLKDAGFCPLLAGAADQRQDPFMTFRGDAFDPSPQLLSPNILKNSDCSPAESPLGDDDQHMTSFMGFAMEDDPELVMKAPYISMAMGDDLPLLMDADDLMWNGGGISSSSSSSSSASASSSPSATPESTSALAELLSASVNKHSFAPQEDDGFKCQQPCLKRLLASNSTGGNGVKRIHASYDHTNKRIKSELPPTTAAADELLQHLMTTGRSNSTSSAGGSMKNKNWLGKPDGNQPSDSVLMNLLDENEALGKDLAETTATATTSNKRLTTPTFATSYLFKTKPEDGGIDCTVPPPRRQRPPLMRKSSVSLLDPDALGIPSLLDLTQQDYEVNAPVNQYLLQGEDLITALNHGDATLLMADDVL